MATKPTKHNQTNIRPAVLFEKMNKPFEKKNSSSSDSNTGTLPSRRICYLQAKCAGDTKKLELIMNQVTNMCPDESCEQSYLREKVKYPSAIPLRIAMLISNETKATKQKKAANFRANLSSIPSPGNYNEQQPLYSFRPQEKPMNW